MFHKRVTKQESNGKAGVSDGITVLSPEHWEETHRDNH
jgi:hypothetical protein